jgi:hypothetical protein
MGSHWVDVDEVERAAIEQRQREQAAEILALERAIAEDHRRRDLMMAGESGLESQASGKACRLRGRASRSEAA